MLNQKSNLLEDKIHKNREDAGIGKDFLSRASFTQELTSKTNKQDYIK